MSCGGNLNVTKVTIHCAKGVFTHANCTNEKRLVERDNKLRFAVIQAEWLLSLSIKATCLFFVNKA